MNKNNNSNLKKENNFIKGEISDLKEENNFIKREISNLKEENNFIKNNSLNLKEENKKFQKEIYNLGKYLNIRPIEKSKITCIIDEHIYGTINFIFNYLKGKIGISVPNINLLYRSSVHGDNTKTLHKLCGNKQNILIVIKSDNGCLFGGYSYIGFKTNKNHEILIDNHSFLFSINKKKIYPIINFLFQ